MHQRKCIDPEGPVWIELTEIKLCGSICMVLVPILVTNTRLQIRRGRETDTERETEREREEGKGVQKVICFSSLQIYYYYY